MILRHQALCVEISPVNKCMIIHIIRKLWTRVILSHMLFRSLASFRGTIYGIFQVIFSCFEASSSVFQLFDKAGHVVYLFPNNPQGAPKLVNSTFFFIFFCCLINLYRNCHKPYPRLMWGTFYTAAFFLSWEESFWNQFNLGSRGFSSIISKCWNLGWYFWYYDIFKNRFVSKMNYVHFI